MSGHSKWATIKHKKAMMDSRRGQVFTKLARAVTIAAKEGGGDISSNFKLRLVIDKAKQFNMPKKNIERAVERGTGRAGGEALTEAVYEGYGPGKIAVMVEVVTDNKNRSVAAIKKVFERSGGSLGQSGSVGYLFTRKGRILVEKQADVEEQMLKLIDLGVEDVEEAEVGVEMLVEANKLAEIKNKASQTGFKIKEAELVFDPKSLLSLDEAVKAKAMKFLETLDDLDDVQNIYTNLDI
jgi:YebC/PmpR family DNA-binding regulatory protein